MERFRIANIVVEGNSVTRDEDIQGIARRVLSGNYFWLYPRSNAALFPRKSIASAIQSEIPRIQEADLELENPQTLHVLVKERVPYALYCRQAEDPSSPVGCFFLDEGGFIFSPAPLFSGAVYFIYTLEAPLSDPIGQTLLPQDEFKAVSGFIERLRGQGIEGQVLALAGDAFHLHLDTSAEIIWKSADSPALVERNLNAFLGDEEVVKDKDFLKKVLYIDLRFNNKVFYKFRDEAAAEAPAEQI
jgi:hypothetical protein